MASNALLRLRPDVWILAPNVDSFEGGRSLEKPVGLQAIQVSSVKCRIAIALIDPRTALNKSYLNVAADDAADWRMGGAFGFAHYDGGSWKALVAPHWFPALLSVVLATIPWFSRSFRFSLRTLLIATTLVAVVLGLIVWL